MKEIPVVTINQDQYYNIRDKILVKKENFDDF
jgi:hypothetical protein